LRLALFPTGAAFTEEGSSAVALLCEEKAKLKFELFLNARSSGTKVMLGKKFSCDFPRPDRKDADHRSDLVVVGVEMHENLLYTGFG
jgi:hypothetical protein